jgi:hypothetical protein
MRCPASSYSRRVVPVAGLGLAALFALVAGPMHCARAAEPIANAVNMEDLGATADGRWIFGSSMAVGEHRGALYRIGADTKRAEAVYPTGILTTAAGPSDVGDANCRREVPPRDFAPHGVSLHENADRALTLYVVNHGARESIEIFSIAASQQQPPAITWIGCVPLPEKSSGNAVAVGADGSIYVTAAGERFSTAVDADTSAHFPGSGVLAWNKRGGWRTLASGVTGLSNGLLVSADQRFLYVADWSKSAVIEVDLRKKAAARVVLLSFMPDNLRWGLHGDIWIGGQDVASPQSVYACFMSQRSSCGLGSGIARLDPGTMTVKCSRHLAATPEFSSATTALELRDEVWLGSFRGASIAISKSAPDGNAGCVNK